MPGFGRGPGQSIRLMYRRFAASFVAIFTALVFSPSGHSQQVLDGIAAVVNDDVITFSQVRDLVGPLEKAARDQFKGEEQVEKIKEIRLKAINDLIDRQLILQEFKKQKFNIPEHFIEERIQTITREEFGGDRAAFTRTLAAQGYSLEKFKQMETDKMIVQAMRGQMAKADTSVPAEKLQQYYQSHREEFTSEEQIKLRMISIKKGGNNSEGRRKMIEEIREKILGGAEFQDLARMYSEDTTQENGGDWGWINRRTLNESLSKIAFALKPGVCSQIIDLGNSYFLLFVEAKKAPETKPFSVVRDDIEKKLLQEQRQTVQSAWTAKLRKKAYIKMF